MSEQDNAAIAQRGYEYFMSGDVPSLVSIFADDVVWDMPKIENVPFSGKQIGSAAVAGFFQLLGENQEPLSFNRESFVAQGDKVVVLGNYVWKVKATGREFSGDFAHAFTFRDGKVVAFREYLDSAALAAAYK